MSSDRGVISRLRAADPVRQGLIEGAPSPELSEQLKARVLASPPTPSTPRKRRWTRRRTIWAVAGALIVAGGAALAAVNFSAGEDVRQATERLTLPSPDRERLTPVPGSLRLTVQMQTDGGQAGLWRFRSLGEGSFVVISTLDRAGNPVDSGLVTGCPPLPRGREIFLCAGGRSASVPLKAAGRVTSRAVSVEARYRDGARVSGAVRSGYFLIVSYSPQRGYPATIVAKDSRGEVVAVTRWFG